MSRVLIVEDHHKLLRSLRIGLESVGFEVLVAETGEEGYQIAISQVVHVVVLDLMLPGKNGFEILTELRAVGFQQPVLILTAKDAPEDRRQGYACGANAFLAKPFALAELVSQLHELLSQRAANPSHGEASR